MGIFKKERSPERPPDPGERKAELIANGVKLKEEQVSIEAVTLSSKEKLPIAEQIAGMEELAYQWAKTKDPEIDSSDKLERLKRQFYRKVDREYVQAHQEPTENDFDEDADEEGGERAAAGRAEAREGVISETVENLADFKEQVKEFLAKKETLHVAVQRMIDANLVPGDIIRTGSDAQEQIIRGVVFASQPQMADYVLAVLRNPKSKEAQDLLPILDSIKDPLSKIYENMRDLEEIAEDVARDSMIGGVKEGFKGVMKEIGKHPGYALGTIGVGIVALTALYHIGNDTVKKWMKGGLGIVAGGAALVAGTYGLDMIVKGARKDKRGLFDLIGFHPDTFAESDLRERMRGMLADMMPGEVAAANDLITLGLTPASLVSEAFTRAMRSGSDSIPSDVFFSRRAVTAEQAKGMGDKTTYRALEHVMLLCAQKAGVSSSETVSDQLSAGLDFFNEHFNKAGKDWKLFYILLYLQGFKPPKEQNPDGSGKNLPPLHLIAADASPEARKAAAKLERVLNEFANLDEAIPVSAVSKDVVLIKGWKFEVKYDKASKTYKLHDPIGSTYDTATTGGGVSKTDAGGLRMSFSENTNIEDARAVARAIVQHVDRAVAGYAAAKWETSTEYQAYKAQVQAEGMGADYPKYEFNKAGYWEFSPPFKTKSYAGFGNAGQEIPIRLYASPRYKEPILIVEGLNPSGSGDAAFTDLREIMERYEEQISFKAMFKNATDFILGGIDVEFDTVTDSGSNETTVSVKYGEQKDKLATFKFSGGKVTEIVAINYDDPELYKAQVEWARSVASEYVNDTIRPSGAFQSLNAAFEGHWRDGLANEFSSMWGRLMEAFDERMGGQEAFVYDREERFEYVLGDFKMRELEYMLAMRAVQKMRGDFTTLSAGAPIPVPDVRAEIEKEGQLYMDAFNQFANEIDARLAAASKQGDGHALEQTLVEYTDKIAALGYENPSYVDFAGQLQNVLRDPGFDWRGPDGFETAQHDRDEFYFTALKLAYPLHMGSFDTGTPPKFIRGKACAPGSDGAKYLDDLAKAFRTIAKIRQKARAGNIGYMVIEDRRVDVSDLEGAFKALGLVPFYERHSEFKAFQGHSAEYSRSLAASALPIAPGSALASGPGNLELHEAMDLLEKKIEKEIIPDYEKATALFIDNDFYHAFHDLWMEGVRTSIATDIATEFPAGKKYSEADVNAFITKHRNDAAAARRDFMAFGPKLNNRRELTKAIDMIAERLVSNSDFKNESRILVNALTGEYEFDLYLTIDEPAILVDVLDIWKEKVGDGTYPTGTFGSPEDYRDYFLYQVVNAAFPNRTNMSPDQLRGINFKELTVDDWKKARPTLLSIPSYSDWLTAGAPKVSKLDALNIPKLTAERVEEDREGEFADEKERFNDWYDENMDLSGFFGWQSTLDDSVERRLRKIEKNASTLAAFKQDLSDFQDFLLEEKQVFEELKRMGIGPNDEVEVVIPTAPIPVPPLVFDLNTFLNNAEIPASRAINDIVKRDEVFGHFFSQSPRNASAYGAELMKRLRWIGKD